MIRKKSQKEQILAAAFELFMANTYNKVSVDDIARKAGVSKGGLFHHFESKYHLARDTILWFFEKEMDPVLSDIREKKGKPEDKIKKLVDVTLKMMVEDIQIIRFLIEVHEEALEREKEIKIWSDILKGYIDQIQEYFIQMKVKNPRLKAIILMATLDGLAMYNIMLVNSGEKVEIEKLRKELYGIFLKKD